MPTLPIPMIIALLLAALLIKRLVERDTHVSLLLLIGVCALQAAIIALVQHYGISLLRPVQPLVATIIPPVAWLAFAHASGADNGRQILFWHGIGPFAILVCLFSAPDLIDVIIPVSFVAYGGAMLLRLARGEASLPHSRLDSGGMPVLAWRVVGVSLLASAACDVLIAYAAATGQIQSFLWVPSIVSSFSLLALGVLSLSQAVESRRESDAEPQSDADAAREREIVAQLEAYLAEHKTYLDPDLTLTRLSRKLMVPAKQLSSAINRVKGENVSRVINRYRIQHAATLLEAGAPVTSVIYESGFNTKSNFNREFLRVMGASPRDWQDAKRLRT